MLLEASKVKIVLIWMIVKQNAFRKYCEDEMVLSKKNPVFIPMLSSALESILYYVL